MSAVTSAVRATAECGMAKYLNTNSSYSSMDRRATGIRWEYKNKFGILDKTFAYDYPDIE